MSRPSKKGLDYFPLDCNLDNKIRALIGKYKAQGFGVFVHILQVVYNNGYFIELNDNIIEDIAIEMGVNEDFIKELISFCYRRSIFCRDLEDKNVLTSHGIQERFLSATKRRVEFNNVDKYIVDADNNLVYVNKNPDNENKSTQRKVKESKGKKKKTYKDMFSMDGFSGDLQETLKDWLEYKKNKYTEIGWKSLKTTLIKAIETFGEKPVIDRITTAMASGWQGMNLDSIKAPEIKSELDNYPHIVIPTAEEFEEINRQGMENGPR